MPKLGARSKRNLSQAHEDIQLLFNTAIRQIDFAVICGYRGEANQNKAYKDGASSLKYPRSKHNKKPSLAVDVIPWHKKAPHIRWDDFESFHFLAGHIFAVAKSLGIKIKWGGLWKRFKDLPHWEKG